MTPLRLRLLASAAAFLIGLPVAELAARLTYGEGFHMVVDPQEDHPYRPSTAYEQVWAGRQVPFFANDLGWKDRAAGRVVEKRPPHPRIVLLGDSFVEGVGCRYEETPAGFLEKTLAASRPELRSLEVLNGGRASFCPLLEYQRLKRFFAAGYRTDLVVLLLDESDPQDLVVYSSRPYERAPDGEPLGMHEWRFKPWMLPLYNNSALLRTVDRWQGAVKGWWRRRGEHVVDEVSAPPSDLRPDAPPLTAARLLYLPDHAYLSLRANWMAHPPSLQGWAGVALEETLADVLRVRRLAAQHGVPLVLVIYPWPQMAYTREDPAYYETLRRYFGLFQEEREMVYGRRPAPRVSVYQQRLHEFSRAQGIPLFDFIPEVQDTPSWHRLYQAEDVHFSPAGNRRLSEGIARFLLAERLVP
ncbi:MAG TPA: hypothetical protein VH988_06430 [Thermoanaerobaculia bacterium]|nr:hypothetical protein [Thermoanaerobaculia bacterium]